MSNRIGLASKRKDDAMVRHSFRRFWLGVGMIAATNVLAAAPGRADTVGLQPRPIPLGVSGGSETLLSVNGLLYCYAGTLGALVTDGQHQYILSNNHVLAKENENLAYGSPDANATIIQEANLDEGPCTITSGDPTHGVADLGPWVPVLFYKGHLKSTDPVNDVDAAIAQVRSDDVNPDGYVYGIGTVNGVADPSTIAVGLPVQKTGRTTAHTFGTIEAVGVSLAVSYESGTAAFVNQIRIRRPCNDAGFSDAGDSGSLIVTVPSDTGTQSSAVALLFAGSSTDTFANPIGSVLSELGGASASLTMVNAQTSKTEDGATMAGYANYQTTNCPSGSGGTGGGGHGGGHGGPHLAAGGPSGLDVALAAKSRHHDEIFALPDVVGDGVGADANGHAVTEIYVSNTARRSVGYPTSIEGIPVRVIPTGKIRPF
jgi:hypothetical protein